MKLSLSAPSKTFLTGEYAVLAGGPAIMLNTGPRFEFVAEKNGQSRIRGIPPGSPAHVWLGQRAPLLNGWSVEFRDPHEGAGGFGASGAQFVLAHAFTTLLQDGRPNAADAFADYHVCSKGAGSGADILAQFTGEAAIVDMRARTATAKAWPYPELGFAILRTGEKIATHVHLENLDPAKPHVLLASAQKCADGFGKMNARDFVLAVNEYADALLAADLQAPRTVEYLKSFKTQTWCLAAKGCGAWGADTLLVLLPKNELARVAAFAETCGLKIAASDLSPGLEVRQ